MLDRGHRRGRPGHEERYEPTLKILVPDLFPYFGSDVNNIAESDRFLDDFLRVELDHVSRFSAPRGMKTAECGEDCPVKLEEAGQVTTMRGISVCTFLKDRRVADRQADAARKYLEARGFQADLEVVYDASNPLQKGSSIVLWMETNTQARVGSDAIGELRKPSETVGREAAIDLVKGVEAKATVDVHLADMLVPYVALAEGTSKYLTRKITDHLDTNIWLMEKVLDVKFQINKVGDIYRIEKG